MAINTIPYNIKSKPALVQLVKEANPDEDIDERYIDLGDMYADPTEAEPGRTFVEMTNRVTKHKDWFAYRRLDISLIPPMVNATALRVKTPITPTSIIAELNRARGLALSDQDFELSVHPTDNQSTAFTLTLPVLAGSPKYYGTLSVNVSPVVVDVNIMRREDDVLMQEEGGAFMYVEQTA